MVPRAADQPGVDTGHNGAGDQFGDGAREEVFRLRATVSAMQRRIEVLESECRRLRSVEMRNRDLEASLLQVQAVVEGARIAGE